MSHLKLARDGTITLVVDGRIFSRSMVKQAAATIVPKCHVRLDLDEAGNVVVTFSPFEGETWEVRSAAGDFGNLLVSELATKKLDAQTTAARNLVVARAMDGALPSDVLSSSVPVQGGVDHEK